MFGKVVGAPRGTTSAPKRLSSNSNISTSADSERSCTFCEFSQDVLLTSLRFGVWFWFRGQVPIVNLVKRHICKTQIWFFFWQKLLHSSLTNGCNPQINQKSGPINDLLVWLSRGLAIHNLNSCARNSLTQVDGYS